ncbi:MAG TPA: universal stress protein [Terriglobales bacterium]|jgi:nucleotide-binding universal stress UspA family protein
MKILVAIDDSRFSEAALRMLIAQNQPRKAAIRVLHVVEPIETAYYPELTPPYPMNFGDIRKRKVEAGRRLADRASAKVRAAGFRVDSSVRLGHVRTTIVDAAAKWHANLIVIGSHGRSGLTRVLLGSVSEYVVRHAPCSVQVVRTRRR